MPGRRRRIAGQYDPLVRTAIARKGGGAGGGSGIAASVANGAALSALGVTLFLRGATAYVQSYGAYWSLQPAASSPAPGGDVVLASSDPAQVWTRTQTGVGLASILKPHWFVDGVAGNNEAFGTTAGTPLKDFGELLRRYGTNAPTYSQNTIIEWIDDDGNAGSLLSPYAFAPVMAQGTLGGGTLLNLVGHKIAVAGGAGVLGVVTPMNVATGAPLTADLGAAAAGHVGFLIVNTDKGNSVAWIDSLVGTVATITQPTAPSVTPPPAWWLGGGFSLPALVNTWAPGDHFQIFRIPKVPFGAVTPTTIGFWAPTLDGILAMMGNLWVPDLTGSAAQTLLINPTLRITECRTDGLIAVQSVANNGVGEQIFNSWLFGSGLFAQLGIFAGAINTADAFIVGLSGGAFGGNVIVHATNGLVISAATGAANALPLLGGVFLFGALRAFAPFQIAGSEYALAYLTGTYTIGNDKPISAPVRYAGTAASAFQGIPTLFANTHATAIAFDPTGPTIHAPRALSPAQLDTTIAGGGFGGIALNLDLSPAYVANASL